jgi:hypothetical protein
MQNPEKQLNDYLDRVTGEIRVLNANLLSLKSIVEAWTQEENKFIADTYWYLFRSLYDLLFDNLILNLSWLFDEKGKRSLIWYLNRMNEQSESFFRKLAEKQVDSEPAYFFTQRSIEAYNRLKRFNAPSKADRRNKIKQTIEKFKIAITTHLNEVNNVKAKYIQLRDVRDKSIAHRDKQAFDDPAEFWNEARLTVDDIECLTSLAMQIVKGHYGILRDAGFDFMPSAYIGINDLLDLLRKYHAIEEENLRMKDKLRLLDSLRAEDERRE